MSAWLSSTDRGVIRRAADLCDSPFFVYDLPAIRKNVSRFSHPGVRFWYACKANPLSAILDVIRGAGLSFDVASLGELEQVLGRGVPGKQILTTGPAKSEAYLRKALDAGLKTFVLESPEQVRVLSQILEERSQTVEALLRLQIDGGGSGKSVLGGDAITAFGVGAQDWLDAKIAPSSFLKIRGVHIFQWGNVLDPERIGQIWDASARAARALAKDLGFSLDVLDLGGGLGIPYSAEKARLDWSSVAVQLERVKDIAGAKEIWLELGRFAVGEHGLYSATVVDRKRVRGEDFLVLDGGMNHLLRPSLVGEPFPVDLLRESKAAPAKFRIHGPLCTALDGFGNLELPSDVKIGDRLVFFQCGAYGFSESMPYFLCHTGAAEFALEEGGELKQVREPLAPKEWMR